MIDPLAIYDLFGELVRPSAEAILKRRFVFPPFTVLNAREGDWQERKRAWLLLGIKSELGRGNNIQKNPCGEHAVYGGGGFTGDKGPTTGHNIASAGGLTFGAFSDAFGNRGGSRAGLTYSGREVSRFDRYREKESTTKTTEESGTSVFDPVLCELSYRWFSPPGGSIIDPFAGGSVRGIVASALGRKYYGCDLSALQISANKEQAELAEGPPPTWVCGDAIDIATLFPYLKADFMFSCPPYADLERYSDDPRDLSTMDYAAFMEAYSNIIRECAELLVPNSFACFVVGDVRGKDGNYYGFPHDTVAAFKAAGMPLYNEAVLVTSVGSLPVRIDGQFSKWRKLGKTHQNILVFVKGDARKAALRCGDLRQEFVGEKQ